MITLPFPPETDPIAQFNRLREQRPVCEVVVPSGEVMWLISRHEDVRALYVDDRFSRDLTAPGSPRTLPEGDWSSNPLSIINMDGARHAARRRPVMAHLTPRKIEALRAPTAALAEQLLGEMMAAAEPADFAEAFAAPMPALSAALIAGVPREDYSFFRHKTWPLATPDQFSKDEYEQATAEVYEYTARLVAAKRAAPGDDATSALIAGVDTGAFPAESLATVIMELMFAGMLNTRSVLCSSMLLLLRRRDWLNRLAIDPGFATRFTNEALRCFPHPLLGLPRLALQDVVLGDVTIRKGQAVLPALVAANRDPAAFTDPDRFDPERPSSEKTLSFGRGPHHCIGSALTRMLLETAFTVIAQRLPSVRLAVPESELTWKNSFVEYGVVRVPIRWRS